MLLSDRKHPQAIYSPLEADLRKAAHAMDAYEDAMGEVLGTIEVAELIIEEVQKG